MIYMEGNEMSFWDLPEELSSSMNDVNLELISAIQTKHGSAYLGRINHMDTGLTEYTGQSIEGFDFCVPTKSPELQQMLKAFYSHGKAPDLHLLNKIYTIIDQQGGHQLLNF